MSEIAKDVFAEILRKARGISRGFARVFEKVGPIQVRPSDCQTVADYLYTAIVGQQLSLSAARSIWLRIEAAARTEGVSIQGLFSDSYLERLRSVGVSGRKARALIAVKDAAFAGRIEESTLAGVSHSDRSAILCSIWGVGQWTADMIGIFYFLDPDIWPNGDVAATKTLECLSGCNDVARTAERFSPHRSILARYMWRFRDQRSGVTP